MKERIVTKKISHSAQDWRYVKNIFVERQGRDYSRENAKV